MISGRSAMPWRTRNNPSLLGSKRAPQLQANSAAELSQSIWVVYREAQELQMTVTCSTFLAIVLVPECYSIKGPNSLAKPQVPIWYQLHQAPIVINRTYVGWEPSGTRVYCPPRSSSIRDRVFCHVRSERFLSRMCGSLPCCCAPQWAPSAGLKREFSRPRIPTLKTGPGAGYGRLC